MIKSILFGKWGDYWQAAWLWRLFYRLKALICCVLNRQPNYPFNFFNYSHIVLTYTASGSYSTSDSGTIYWFEAIAVGDGLFRNWWCTYYQDSSD